MFDDVTFPAVTGRTGRWRWCSWRRWRRPSRLWSLCTITCWTTTSTFGSPFPSPPSDAQVSWGNNWLFFFFLFLFFFLIVLDWWLSDLTTNETPAFRIGLWWELEDRRESPNTTRSFFFCAYKNSHRWGRDQSLSPWLQSTFLSWLTRVAMHCGLRSPTRTRCKSKFCVNVIQWCRKNTFLA